MSSERFNARVPHSRAVRMSLLSFGAGLAIGVALYDMASRSLPLMLAWLVAVLVALWLVTELLKRWNADD